MVLMVAAFWIGLRMAPQNTMRGAGFVETQPAIVSLTVRDSSGARVPLAEPGEAAVVMISSGSCSYCARSLADIARIADGDPVHRLRILTLDGVDNGRRMTSQAGTLGVWHAEPDGRASEAMLALNIPGTPVFLLVDDEGRVRRSMPGYPGRDGLVPWVDVMLGRADSLVHASEASLTRTPAVIP